MRESTMKGPWAFYLWHLSQAFLDKQALAICSRYCACHRPAVCLLPLYSIHSNILKAYADLAFDCQNYSNYMKNIHVLNHQTTCNNVPSDGPPNLVQTCLQPPCLIFASCFVRAFFLSLSNSFGMQYILSATLLALGFELCNVHLKACS